MKILAATKKQNGSTKYIAELESKELLAILSLGAYSNVDVKDENGQITTRDKEDLKSGDLIEKDFILSVANEIRLLRELRSDIDKSFTNLLGSITKVRNILPKQNEYMP